SSASLLSASRDSRQKSLAWSRSSRLRRLSCVTVSLEPGPSPASRHVTWLSGSKSNSRHANSSLTGGTAEITRPRKTSPFHVLSVRGPPRGAHLAGHVTAPPRHRHRSGARGHGGNLMLTPRQYAAYEFIAGFLERWGFAPSYEEIRRHLGLRSLNAVAKLIAQLRRRGV